ncbi:HalOD1 output domain-containing protein [Halomicrococcus sp. NG-SE-24]|uniref:HalOD1 output domain-containing protein n=1 Tax=Halomicrococcus sp. NG-SE-24 TaxID=3436928 RepID=UPI003D97717D
MQWRKGTGRSPSTAVVQTVAAEIGVPPQELRPLYQTINPDALDSLFSSKDQSNLRSNENIVVSFEFEGCDVTVSGDGCIAIVLPDSDEEQ